MSKNSISYHSVLKCLDMDPLGQTRFEQVDLLSHELDERLGIGGLK